MVKCNLQLLLFNFKTSALLIQFMNGSSTITKLVKQVLDLISQILVLPLDYVKLLNNFITCSSEAEKFTVVVAVLLLAGINFSSNIVCLGLPFTNNLVKVSSSFFSDDCCSMSALILHGNFFKVRLHSSLGFFTVGNLGLQSLHSLLSLLDTCLQLVAGHLQFINPAHSLSLIP